MNSKPKNALMSLQCVRSKLLKIKSTAQPIKLHITKLQDKKIATRPYN